MGDDARSYVTRIVYQQLKRAAFREYLTARDPDGGRPVIVALPSDPIRNMLNQVSAAGGTGNVVVAREADLVVLPICRQRKGATIRVPTQGTVGEFIEDLLASMKSGHDASSMSPTARGGRGVGRLVSVPVCA
jgi:hypothetical protein